MISLLVGWLVNKMQIQIYNNIFFSCLHFHKDILIKVNLIFLLVFIFIYFGKNMNYLNDLYFQMHGAYIGVLALNLVSEGNWMCRLMVYDAAIKEVVVQAERTNQNIPYHYFYLNFAAVSKSHLSFASFDC